MVVKVYISGISGNKEVKKRQQRVLMILDSKNITYEIIDITEPGKEVDKDFMQNNAKSNGGTVSDPNPRSPLPPQLFNDEEYCGDYDQFDLANEIDTLEQFLKLELPPEDPPQADKVNAVNGDIDGDKDSKQSKENSQEKETIVSNENGEKEPSPAKEGSLPKESLPSREASPVKEETSNEAPTLDKSPEDNIEVEADSTVNESSQEKEKSPERQKSVDKDQSPVREEAHKLAENEEVINGAVSSREQSEEKDEEQTGKAERKPDDPSLALIQNEQAAAE